MSLPRPRETGIEAMRRENTRLRQVLASQQSTQGTISYGTVQAGRVLTPEGAAPSLKPPTPSGLTIEAAAAGFTVTWSGSAEQAIPVDFARLAIHASKISGYTPTQGTEVNAITSPNGGIATTDADPGDTYYIRCALVTLLGVPSEYTAEVAVIPTSPAGGTQTYRQATAPATGNEGDTWYDSDDGNKPYRWESGAWVAVELGGSALSADAIVGKTLMTAASGRRIEITSSDPPVGGVPGADFHNIYFVEDVAVAEYPTITANYAAPGEQYVLRVSGAVAPSEILRKPEITLTTYNAATGGGAAKGTVEVTMAETIHARTVVAGGTNASAGFTADQTNGLRMFGGFTLASLLINPTGQVLLDQVTQARAIGLVRAVKVSTTDSIGTAETQRLVTSAISARTGTTYIVIGVCHPSIDTAGGWTNVRLRHDTASTGVTGTEFVETLRDHRLANRREATFALGDFTWAGADQTTIYIKLTMDANGGTGSDEAANGPTAMWVLAAK